MPLLTIDHLELSYQAGEKTLDDIDFHINQHEFVSIIGSSGCGKSSLLNVIAGFIPPSEGQVTVNGHQVMKPNPERGVVFQDLALFPWLNVLDNVAFGLKMQGIPKEERISRSKDVIQLVGLKNWENAKISDLSGGMKQRVAIARTIVTEPAILLMDEPFSALDAQTRELLQDELLRIQREKGMTVMLVTHSIDEAVYLSDRVIVMQKNGGSIKDIIPIELERPRLSTLRVSAQFNQYKKRLMEELYEAPSHGGSA